MRGTDDRNAFLEFVKATRLFPPTEQAGLSAQDVFKQAYGILEKLVAEHPGFPRARAWYGYALALTVSEGWPIDGFADGDPKITLEGRLDIALQRAKAARDMDPTDYDLWWALANVHLIRREFEDAEAAFNEANFLNQDEVNANLEAETADALVHLGKLTSAEQRIRRAARRPDWYRWIRAWTYFVTAGRSASDELTFLDLALDEIKRTFGQPGDESYILEVQLLLAAVHAAKREVYLKADPKDEPRKEEKAARQLRATQKAMERFDKSFGYWDEAQAIRFAPFRDGRDEGYWRRNINAAFSVRGGATAE
jgi:tetratricopeptide (TPR) repeat protein